MEFLRDWLTRPKFEDDSDDRVGGVLHIASQVFFICGILFSLIVLISNNTTTLPFTVLAIVLGILLHALIRKRRIKSASLLFSSCLFIAVCAALTHNSLKSGFWEYDVAFVGFILPVLVSGLLSGERAAFMFATLAVLIGFGILINQFQLVDYVNNAMSFGDIAPQHDLLFHWIAESMLFLFTAGMVSYMNRTLTISLKTVRQNERLLAQRNIQLQNEIAERQLAEAQVRELSRERGRVDALSAFISNVSHDLKTPLSIINTNAYLLGRLEDPQKRREKIEAIKDQSNRLDRSIQDMLIMAQLDNVMELDLQKLDISTLVTQIAARFHEFAKQKRIALWLLPTETLFVRGNSVELERALSAIVENAINYTPPEGHVILEIYAEVRVTNEYVTIKIADDGIGISADDLSRIFDRLYRADKARSINSGGTGLGLPIAEKIIRLHKGQIIVESSPGNGTDFFISLPRLEKSESIVTNRQGSVVA